MKGVLMNQIGPYSMIKVRTYGMLGKLTCRSGSEGRQVKNL